MFLLNKRIDNEIGIKVFFLGSIRFIQKLKGTCELKKGRDEKERMQFVSSKCISLGNNDRRNIRVFYCLPETRLSHSVINLSLATCGWVERIRNVDPRA